MPNSKDQNEQYYCIDNPPVQCVDVRFLSIVNGKETQRHLDQILMQVVSRVGPINRLFINNNPRFYGAYETTSTIAHIELMDHNNHPELARMLDGHKFHGNFLKVSAGKHVFHGLDFGYRLRGINCIQCTQFSENLYNYEHPDSDQSDDESPQLSTRSSNTIQEQQQATKFKDQLEVNQQTTSIIPTVSSSLVVVNECCVCFQKDLNLIKPIFTKLNDRIVCSHNYCSSCFKNATVVEMDDSKAVWDGYPAVSFMHRIKTSPQIVWSCQLCRSLSLKN